MPRIISGSGKGTRLAAPAGLSTRPTADRVKEALFSILQPLWPADGFLDLYAGTGQIGLEAASRGASRVILVENDRHCRQIIKENCNRSHLDQQAKLLGQDVHRAVMRLVEEAQQFDIVFADPPYQQIPQELTRLSGRLALLLAPGGRFILEHDARMTAPIVTNLQLERSCQYGTAMLSFYKGAIFAAR
jgi:16S rRNA (guanine(966)-N(2))-methyltransferase RsmD